MPRPFPFPINVGTDICSVQRIFRLITERGPRAASRFPQKILTPNEWATRSHTLSIPLGQWWDLQKKRELLGVEYKLASQRAPWDHSSFGRVFREHANDKEFRNMELFEDSRHIHLRQAPNIHLSNLSEEKEAADLGSPPVSAVGSLENAASADDMEDTTTREAESSSEFIGASKGPLFQKRQESETADVANTQNAEGPDAETPVAVIADQQGQNEESRSLLRARELLDEDLKKLYPTIWNAAQFLAGRFAAKEAAIKAYQTRRLTYQDIQIVSQPPRNGMTQAPIAMVISESGDWDDGQIIPMSISHDGGFATAVCMAYEKNAGAVFETANVTENSLSSKAKERKAPAAQTRQSESRPEIRPGA